MQLIYGINPLEEALSQENPLIERLFLATNHKNSKIEQMARGKNIPIEMQSKDFFSRLPPANQGAAGVMREFRYSEFTEILKVCADNNRATVLVLDEISDPQNIGAIIRVAHCGGIDGVILPVRRACPITPAVIKASSGAIFSSRIAQVGNIVMAMEQLKSVGFWIYGAEADAPTDIAEIDFAAKVALVVGSEGRGMRRLVKEKCDALFSLPLRGKIGSLNVAVATGIIVYERERRNAESKK
ncbi:MAG: 23S rRNA (guanosine(2251)-2'-O)-methyltransferase RlmB [Deltaproteobacteria bacterium]|nr:23S rRNA (guanosine(2251)-2'-O)-methyltransferase RlmB [Deltaproteobacteria bacterium]